MSTADHIKTLIDRGTELLSRYAATHSTDLLRELAPIVVELREMHTLSNGLPDWSGRSPGYRQAMADLYTRARVPDEQLDTVQAALRYHVGNLIRERASEGELEAQGLKAASPKERLAVTRHALAAQKAVAAPKQDIARLTAYAQALLDFVDDETIPSIEPERAVASRIALENVQRRSAELLVRIADAAGKPAGRPEEGRHRRRSSLGNLAAL